MSLEQESIFRRWLKARVAEQPVELDSAYLRQALEGIDASLDDLFKNHCPSSLYPLRKFRLELNKEKFLLMGPLMSSFFQDLWSGVSDLGIHRPVRPRYIGFSINRMPEAKMSDLLGRPFVPAMMTAYSGVELFGSVAVNIGGMPKRQEGVSVVLTAGEPGFYELSGRRYAARPNSIVPCYSEIMNNPLVAACYAGLFVETVANLAAQHGIQKIQDRIICKF